MQKEKIQSSEKIKKVLSLAASKIAPLWSLENFVAVNPYLGMADKKFGEVMQQLHITAEAKPTLPISFYLEALEQGRITRQDLTDALKANDYKIEKDVDEFLQDLLNDPVDQSGLKVKTVSDLASSVNGKDWRRFMIDRISQWAAAYFDEDQAIWNTQDKKDSIFQAWKKEAEVDRSPDLMGLTGFRKLAKQLPNDYLTASEEALAYLEVPENASNLYLHRLLMTLCGWAGFTARIDWDARLAGNDSNATQEFLAILLSWEVALLKLLPYSELEKEWSSSKLELNVFDQQQPINRKLAHHLILQDAFDRANQRQIISKITNKKTQKKEKKTPKVQAIFCIDVRSELYRRNLEAVDPEIETMGFAGFFAFPVNYVPLGHTKGSSQCPVLLTTSHTIKETTADTNSDKKAIEKRSLEQHVTRAWHSFKLGAISCFSFVGPVGLSYLPKLFTDSFGMSRPITHPDEDGLPKKILSKKSVDLGAEIEDGLKYGISEDERLQMAETTLRAMSLTENFARTVMIVGHGSTTVNNPHASGLDCGACGGHTGEANAKVAAAVLNDIKVRDGLKTSGINVPDSTIFIACQHDTTTDEITIFNEDNIPASHQKDLKEIKYATELAAQSARKERGLRMNLEAENADTNVLNRSRDWSQVRPEWGLAGCSSFIVAPRERTQGLDFAGKAFLHSYDWQKDKEFGVLELIMTAPMVVTSWINLQYYASTVDNQVYGSGNKTLHNVVGGLGVFEGFAGDLRVGLPWQSVHDGEKYQHEPQRLNVIIEAPVDEMSKILKKHQSIRDLCDNEWIYLFAMNDEGKVAYKYIGNLEWEVVS